MLVAIDSNVVDLIEAACCSQRHIDALQAMEPPPRFEGIAPSLEPEVLAAYWLIAMAPAWRSTIYTFSDELYNELSHASRANPLLRVAFDVLVREQQEQEHRIPDPARRPSQSEVEGLGLKLADARHVADAVGLSCGYLLTNDRKLRNKSAFLEVRWQLAVRRPSEFLCEAVRKGAAWTTRAPWPWEALGRPAGGGPDTAVPDA